MIINAKSQLIKKKDYSGYPFMNLSLESMEEEQWKDIPQFDGCYRISNFGRIWAAPRPVNTITGRSYYTKERIRKQTLTRFYNSYTQDYTEQLAVKLRFEGKNYGFKVSRLVYAFFVASAGVKFDDLLVAHKDGDNCNNHCDNLVLMNGTELYRHGLRIKRRPRSGQVIKKEKWSQSDKNAPRAIIQYDLSGKILNEYESIEKAAVANKTTRGSIRAVAIQNVPQLYGFVYRFKGIPYHGEHAGFSFEKEVTQYDLNGRKIKTYPSVKEAGNQTGISPSTISKCALRKFRFCGGFVWRYQGDTYGGEYRDKIKNKAKKIFQYSLDGKKIARFSSANQASKATGFSPAVILDCAKGKSKVSHGCVWRFAGDPYLGEHKQYQRGKPVTQRALDGKWIATYPSIEDAARATGLTPDNIQKNVKGHNKTAGGFAWKYATPEELESLSPFKPEENSRSRHGKKVIQYSMEGKKLGVYPSISEAAKACGINVTGISSALNAPNRAAAGFVWRTKENSYKGELVKTPPANKPRNVTQYDMQGDKVNVYKSTKEAERLTGVSSSTISSVARGKLKSTGGFVWIYGNGPEKVDIAKHYASTRQHMEAISKPVVKYSLEGELLNEYPSIRAAARAEGISADRISSVINGTSKSAGGDFWKIKE